MARQELADEDDDDDDESSKRPLTGRKRKGRPGRRGRRSRDDEEEEQCRTSIDDGGMTPLDYAVEGGHYLVRSAECGSGLGEKEVQEAACQGGQW